MQPVTPVIAAIFFQANTIKGFEAWDKAGLIANHFADRFQTISYGPLGLVCAKPADPEDALLEARVDTQMIHLTYRPASTWDTIIRETPRQTEWIARAIAVSAFSRIGLRLYLVWPIPSIEKVSRLMHDRLLALPNIDWQSLGAVDPGELVVQVDAEDVQARLAIRAAARNRGDIANGTGAASVEWATREADFPDYGLMFDLDLFRARSTASVDLQAFLRWCREYVAERIVPLGQRLMEKE